MPVIDADCHVIETERTFEYMEESESAFKPLLAIPKSGPSSHEYWLIDGRYFAKNVNMGDEQSSDFDVASQTPQASRELSDMPTRLSHMDELGIDIQVLYPTMFLRPITRRPEVDLAICRSYNRWMADIWKAGENRLRWIIVPPLLTMDKALEELNFSKQNGACGILIRPVEGERLVSDPYFFPLYEEASRLNLPICIHSATGNFGMVDLLASEVGFSQFKLPTAGAFHDLLFKGVPEKFPDLRWGFMEASSSWVPWALSDIGMRLKKAGRYVWSDALRENNVYVEIQTWDDRDYVLQFSADNSIVLGTDYGHNDTAAEIEALRKLRTDGKVPGNVVDKILGDNPKELYGL